MALVAALALTQYGPDPPDTPDDVKCGWRSLAYEYGVKLRPDADALLKAALAVGAPSNCSLPSVAPRTAAALVEEPRPAAPASRPRFHVDGSRGHDLAGGSAAQPLKTIQAAVERCRLIDGACDVSVRGGTYHLSAPLRLDERDSGLSISSEGGRAWLSGGVPLTNLKWRREGSGRVWSADLSASGLTEIASLRVDGERRSPARWPNADPETQFWPTGYETSKEAFAPKGDWLGPAIAPIPNPALEVNVSSPNRDWDAQFRAYRGGINGTCSIYEPPFSFWCQSPPFSAGCGGCFTWSIPSGLKAAALANRPAYEARGRGAQLFAWRKAHWANWVFDVASIDQRPNGSSIVTLAAGGWQGARGGAGSDWYLSNVREELDDPLEFFFDEATRRLYAVSDGSDGGASPPRGREWVAIPYANHTLLAVDGSQAAPVRNLTLDGLGFRDAAWTMMRPHGVPSGGDWALERLGALFVEGTEGATLSNLSFVRVDGNALMLSRYHRDAAVRGCDFSFLGGSAVALWGWTDELSDGGVHGVDSTAGDFAWNTTIERNLFREIGIWEKQSSAVFQGKAAGSTIRHNVVFNLARAGFNFNDGHGPSRSPLAPRPSPHTARPQPPHSRPSHSSPRPEVHRRRRPRLRERAVQHVPGELRPRPDQLVRPRRPAAAAACRTRSPLATMLTPDACAAAADGIGSRS